jgi:hypothetical protein
MPEAHTNTGTYLEGLVVHMYTKNVGTELAADDQEICVANDDDVLEVEAVEVLPPMDDSDGNASDEASADSVEDANVGSGKSWMDDNDYRLFYTFYKSPSKATIGVADDVEHEFENVWEDIDGVGKGKNVLASSYGSSKDGSDEDYVQPLCEDIKG